MKKWLEGSIIFRTVVLLLKAYNESMIMRAVSALGIYYSHSTTRRATDWYLDRESGAVKSNTYKVLARFGSLIDTAAGRSTALISRAFSESLCGSLSLTLRKGLKQIPNLLLAAFLISFTAGFILLNTFMSLWSPSRAGFALMLLFISVLSLFTADKWKIWLTNSGCWRALLYLWE